MRNRLVLAAGTACAVGVFYELVAPEFLIANYLLALVTYSAVLPLVVMDTRTLASTKLYSRTVRVIVVMLAVEGTVGIVQAVHGAIETGSFGGANGDYVAGTIHPYLTAELAFSNPVFAVNMTIMLVATLALPEFARGRLRALVLGAIALVLASVVHVLVFLVIAVVFAVATTRRTGRTAKRRLGTLMVAGALVAGFGYFALSDNLAGISRVGAQAIDLEAVDIPRAILLSRVATELPEDAPVQPYIGLGPGQFSSRASLIASGLYLGGPDSPRPVPLLSSQATGSRAHTASRFSWLTRNRTS